MSEVKYIPPFTIFYLNDDWAGEEYPEIVNVANLRLIFQFPVKAKYIPLLVEFSKKFERTEIVISSVFTRYDGWGFEFIENFSHLNGIILKDYNFVDYQQLNYIPSNIDSFELCETKSKKLSLTFLARFKALMSLKIESHQKDIEVISELTNLQKLAVRSITLPDLQILTPLKKLSRLEIRLGGTRDLSLLPEIKKLKFLELWSIYKLIDIDAISEAMSLEHIFLDQLKHIENIQSFEKMNKLKILRLNRMKGLKSLKWAADAPALEIFSFTDARQLVSNDFACFIGHKKLKRAEVLMSKKKNEEVKKLLNLNEKLEIKA